MCAEWYSDPRAFYEWGMSHGWREGLTIDRINNDSDYCPDNCRWVTQAENNRNQRLIRSNNTSGYRGVYWNKQRQKWMAYSRYKGKMKGLGYFDDPKAAAKVRDEHVIKCDIAAPLNFA